MTCEATLRTDAQSLQGLLLRFSTSFSYTFSSVQDSILHCLSILQLWEFRSDDSKYHVFVPGEMFQWLEGACSLGVVFEIVCVDVDGLEKLDGYSVVPSLAEVTRTDEVASAQVETYVHVGRASGETVVV